MKVNGVQVTRHIVPLVLPREGQDIVFKAQSVNIAEDFESLYTMPEPPVQRKANGQVLKDFKDAGYIQQMENYNKAFSDYTVIRSLEPSNIEWETVDLQSNTSWANWRSEMSDAGLSDREIKRILDLVSEANSLDDAKIQAALDSFLATQLLEATAE